MRFLSVCSGIEAASVAWSPLGWKALAFSEIEAFPSAVLAHHYPDTPNFGDMTKFKDWPDGAIDLLCGGTPCQSFSAAGLRAGLDDPRGQLMLTFGSIAARYRPRWLVWENVPGVLSSNGGRDFGAFLGLLGYLGYGFAYRVLDAQFVRVDGYARAVPQRRQRVFVVGCLRDWRSAAAVLLERESLRGDSAPRRSTGSRVAACLTRGAESSGKGGYAGRRQEDDVNIVAGTLAGNGLGAGWQIGSDEAAANCIVSIQGNLIGRDKGGPVGVGVGVGGEMYTLTKTDVHGVAYCLNAKGGGGRLDGESETLIPTTGAGFDAAMPFDTTQITSAANRSNPKAGDPCHPLAAVAHAPAVAFGWQNAAAQGMPVDTISPTLDKSKHPAVLGADCFNGALTGDIAATMGTRGSSETASGPTLLTGAAVRRLMPVECERLQGFPDGYTAIPWRGKPASDCPDGPRYKALGNSWAVNCARWVGQRIAVVDGLSAKEEA